MEGSKATVCTTYEEHVAGDQDERRASRCSSSTAVQIGDVVCLTFENAGRGMALSATATMFAVAQNMRFDTSSVLWTAATDEWSFWQWAILAIALRRDGVGDRRRHRLRRPRPNSSARSCAPSSPSLRLPLTLWATGHLLNAIDDLTWYVMNRNGPAGLFSTLQSVMWAGGQANYFFAFVIHGLLMIGMLLLMLVFTFRNIVLAALIAVGPIAWMLYPVRSVGPQWVVRYVSAVAVLLLTGPLTIGFVTLIINGLANVTTIWDPQSWPLLVGLVLVAFAPFAIFGLFSFVGAVAADGVGSRVGSGAGRAASSAARSVVSHPQSNRAFPGGRDAGLVIGDRRASAALGSGGPSLWWSATRAFRPRGSVRSLRPVKPSSPSSPRRRRRLAAQAIHQHAPTLAYRKDRVMTTQDLARPVRLPRRSRQGVVMGMDGWQLTCVTIAAVVVLIGVNRFGPPGLLYGAPIYLPLGAFAFVTVHGDSAPRQVGLWLMKQLRHAVGATKHLYRPERPHVAGTLNLPGIRASVQLWDVDGVACVYNPHDRSVTVTAEVEVEGFLMKDIPERFDLAQQWSPVLASFTQRPGIKRAVLQERTIPTTIRAARDHYEAVRDRRGLDAASAVNRNYEEVLNRAEPFAVVAPQLPDVHPRSHRAGPAAEGARRR